MEKGASSNQADAAVFSQLQAENEALKKENAALRQKLERMNELLLNAQRARFGQSSEKRTYVLAGGEQLRLFVTVKSGSVQKHRVRRKLDAVSHIGNQFVLHSAGAFQGSNSWTFFDWLRSISAAVDISQDK